MWAERDESRLQPKGVCSIREVWRFEQRYPAVWRVACPHPCADVFDSQTVDFLSDPGLESEAFDGRGDGEGQIPKGSDGLSGVVEDQPPVEEEIADRVGWG